jgi:hypothetical protein
MSDENGYHRCTHCRGFYEVDLDACGGRGFDFDIHPRDPGWECVECKHRYAPADGTYITTANCKSPKCGCTEASGWWDDEYDEDAEFDGEYGEE